MNARNGNGNRHATQQSLNGAISAKRKEPQAQEPAERHGRR